jgi:hypothetical protein
MFVLSERTQQFEQYAFMYVRQIVSAVRVVHYQVEPQ